MKRAQQNVTKPKCVCSTVQRLGRNHRRDLLLTSTLGLRHTHIYRHTQTYTHTRVHDGFVGEYVSVSEGYCFIRGCFIQLLSDSTLQKNTYRHTPTHHL